LKKQLLSTSAVALGVAMAAAPASAQDWNVDWGGFMNAHVAFVDVGGLVGASPLIDYDGLAQFTTGEIIFHPSVTLDNGLTFGVNVQFEALNNVGGAANNVDEAYVEISGDQLGTILIGAENSAGYKSMVGAPTVTTMWINSASISAFMPISFGVPFNFRQAGISTWTEVGGNNDVNRLTYFSPDFNGLTVGVSYARNNACNAAMGFGGGGFGVCNNNAGPGGPTLENIWDIGAYYSGTFGTTNVQLSARYGSGDGVAVGAPDADTWGVGAQVGFGAVSIGGSYTENDNGNGLIGTGFDQSGWSFGATYDAPGPWSFEAVTYQGNYDNVGGPGIDADYSAYRIGANREIGPGVNWNLYAVFAEGDFDGTVGTDVDGTIIGTAVALSF
jgi:predicted porin